MTALQEAARLWSPRPLTSSSLKSTRSEPSGEGPSRTTSVPTPPSSPRVKRGRMVTSVALGGMVEVGVGEPTVVRGLAVVAVVVAVVVSVVTSLSLPPHAAAIRASGRIPAAAQRMRLFMIISPGFSSGPPPGDVVPGAWRQPGTTGRRTPDQRRQAFDPEVPCGDGCSKQAGSCGPLEKRMRRLGPALSGATSQVTAGGATTGPWRGSPRRWRRHRPAVGSGAWTGSTSPAPSPSPACCSPTSPSPCTPTTPAGSRWSTRSPTAGPRRSSACCWVWAPACWWPAAPPTACSSCGARSSRPSAC